MEKRLTYLGPNDQLQDASNLGYMCSLWMTLVTVSFALSFSSEICQGVARQGDLLCLPAKEQRILTNDVAQNCSM